MVPPPRLATKTCLLLSLATPAGLFSRVRLPAILNERLGVDVVLSGVKTKIAFANAPFGEVLATTTVPSLSNAMP